MRSGPETDSEQSLIWLREEPCSRKPGHSRARIAAAAVGLADSEGFEAVSMRRVAQELGVGTMTLYHYVANKDELVTLMMDAVMGEVLVPADRLPGEWRPAMARIAISTLEVPAQAPLGARPARRAAPRPEQAAPSSSSRCRRWPRPASTRRRSWKRSC